MAAKFIYETDSLSLDRNSLVLNETIFHNANGYIGIRSNFEEGYPDGFDSIRGSYINGFYDIAEMKQAEKLYGFVEEKETMLNVADTQGIRVSLDGEEFSMFEGTVQSSRRILDMEGGYTVREVVWSSPLGKEIRITSKRMASFCLLTLFTIEYTVESLNFDGEIQFTSTHVGDVKNYSNPDDPRVAGESFCHLIPVDAELRDGISTLITDTSRSGLSVCTSVKNVLSKGAKEEAFTQGHRAFCRLCTQIRPGECITLTKYSAFVDSIRYPDVRAAAGQEMEKALAYPMEHWYEKQRSYLKHFWEQSDLEIEGDDGLSLAVRYNLYQLIQSVGKDEHCNIAAKGLSGEGYEGHYFWDTEMYIQPFFVLTNPELARNLIAYRYSILDAARENARILGHEKGALYPWRTISGRECSGYYPSGTAQYHINGDIAYSVTAYYLASKDLDFIAQKGAEILFETARLWMDVGYFDKGRFVINAVTGPDEYTCMVNNNYYTNVSAQYNLHWAVRFYELLETAGKLSAVKEKINLKESELEEFKRAEACMYLPYDEELGINPQDDSFLSKPVWNLEETPREKFPLLLHCHPLHLYRYQVCKQADTVLAHFIFEDAQSLETIRKSFEYYEKITTHDSSLSTCIYSIVAGRLGLAEKAYRYFGDSAKLDLFNTHHNTKDGIHTANMGGNYMAVVYGFGGLRLKESGIHFRPALPRQWTGYKFKIKYEGSQIQVRIDGSGAVFKLMAGEPKKIFVYGQEYLLDGEQKVLLRAIQQENIRYKAVIFDLDGVICHTDKYHYEAWKSVADKLGIYFDESINNRLRGVSRMESFEIILERYSGIMSEEDKVRYASEKNERYKELLKNMTPEDLSPEVKETLDTLRRMGIRMAIGSSSKNAGFILERLGLGDYFDAVSDGNNIKNSKPDPEVFLKAAQYLQEEPSVCLVVEDAEAGLQAAAAAGMDSAAIGDAVKCGLGTYDLRTFSELAEVVKGG